MEEAPISKAYSREDTWGVAQRAIAYGYEKETMEKKAVGHYLTSTVAVFHSEPYSYTSVSSNPTRSNSSRLLLVHFSPPHLGGIRLSFTFVVPHLRHSHLRFALQNHTRKP